MKFSEIGGLSEIEADRGTNCGFEGRPGAEEGAEKMPRGPKSVPQRLKPHCKQSSFGTAEAVPLSETDFFNTL